MILKVYDHAPLEKQANIINKMAASSRSLEDVFKSFCAFGEGQKGVAAMDNAKFAKLTRDLKLLDKKLTSTDVDIIFSKVKA